MFLLQKEYVSMWAGQLLAMETSDHRSATPEPTVSVAQPSRAGSTN